MFNIQFLVRGNSAVHVTVVILHVGYQMRHVFFVCYFSKTVVADWALSTEERSAIAHQSCAILMSSLPIFASVFWWNSEADERTVVTSYEKNIRRITRHGILDMFLSLYTCRTMNAWTAKIDRESLLHSDACDIRRRSKNSPKEKRVKKKNFV